MQSKLVFGYKAISSCFLISYLLYFLILPIIAQIFNRIVELIITLEILTKEAKAKMEIHAVFNVI